MFPGLVKTENFDASLVPFPVNIMFGLGLMTVATTPDQFAPYAVYVSLMYSLHLVLTLFRSQ